MPSYLVVENLEIRSAHPSYGFTDDQGASRTYADNAASIYVEKAQHLVIRNCALHDSGNGLFIGAYDGDTQDVRIEGNWIHGNGNVGSAYEHNTYTAAIGIVYHANRFGPPRAGAIGNNLKDRSAFADAAAQDFHLLETSEAADAATELHPDVLPAHDVVLQYQEHQASGPRPVDGAPDLGAFEVLPEPAGAPAATVAFAFLGLLASGRRRRA